MKRALAWGVHAYTATGLVLGAAAAVQIVDGSDAALRRALLLLLAAALIDATDGMLARRARVAEKLPAFDGRRLDDIIDFHTYTSLPLLLIWRADALPGAPAWLLVFALLASAYGFSQSNAKTQDGYFLGFPSYWNVVAVYVFLLRPPPALTAGIVFVLAVLTFVPSRYLYPSMGGTLNRITLLLAWPWLAVLLLALTGSVPDDSPVVRASLLFPIWYMAASFQVSLSRRRRPR